VEPALSQGPTTRLGRLPTIAPALPVGWARLLDRCQVLSLDIFDTALWRRVGRPTDVFGFVERQAAAEGAPVPGFARARALAERQARALSQGRGRQLDVTLDEIYARLSADRGWDCARLRVLELEAERALSAPRPFIHALAEGARRRSRRVVFVSDMYLPEHFLAELLAQGGFDASGGVWASGARGGTKASGALYREVLAALEVPAEAVLHVGDHPFVDGVRALKSGIPACLYVHGGAPSPLGDGPDLAALNGLSRGIDFGEDVWFDIGFSALGLGWVLGGGELGELTTLAGGDALTLWLERLLEKEEEDRRGQALRRGADRFLLEWRALNASFRWLAPTPEGALAALVRLRDHPTRTERVALATLR
jgi:FMN phosphatase YigB (HAD superfamily)